MASFDPTSNSWRSWFAFRSGEILAFGRPLVDPCPKETEPASLNIIVYSLEPWITLHQVCLKPQLLEIAVAPFKNHFLKALISWDFWDAASIFIWELEWWWGPYENQLYALVIEQLGIAENTDVQNNRQGKICSYWICQAIFHSKKAKKFTQRFILCATNYFTFHFHTSHTWQTHTSRQRFFSSW